MMEALLLGCAAVLALARFGPRLVRRLPPVTATWLLGATAVTMAASTLWVLGILAFTAIAQVPLVAAAGDWSRPILRATDPIPTWVGVACGLLWVAAAGLGGRGVRRRLRALAALRRVGDRFGAAESLVILDLDRAEAFATPAGPGRVYVTTGMLKALRPDERRAVLAHEFSHLAHRHTWWVLAGDLCAIVNPLLTPTARALAHAVERWADEDAARVVGDRRTVARAVARAALHANAGRAATVVMSGSTSAVGGRVPDRVAALLVPAPRPRPVPAFIVAALLLVSIASAVTVQGHTEAFFDNASAGTRR